MIHALNWMQVEAHREREARAVVPLGSSEPHACPRPGSDTIPADLERARWLPGAGSSGGVDQEPDDVVERGWPVGVEETRSALEGPRP